MNTKERVLLMARIAGLSSSTGRTAMMKYMYLLQTLYDVPLEYDFEIYTYGPFCQTVMSDIEYGEHLGLLEVHSVTYPNGASGYDIKAVPDKKVAAKKSVAEYKKEIVAMLNIFGHKNAKELELDSTIVFVAKSKLVSSADIVTTVHTIKPHFSKEVIEKAVEELAKRALI